MMHTELDTETVARTLARYGVQHRSTTYYRIRAIVRATWMLACWPLAYMIGYVL